MGNPFKRARKWVERVGKEVREEIKPIGRTVLKAHGQVGRVAIPLVSTTASVLVPGSGFALAAISRPIQNYAVSAGLRGDGVTGHDNSKQTRAIVNRTTKYAVAGAALGTVVNLAAFGGTTVFSGFGASPAASAAAPAGLAPSSLGGETLAYGSLNTPGYVPLLGGSVDAAGAIASGPMAGWTLGATGAVAPAAGGGLLSTLSTVGGALGGVKAVADVVSPYLNQAAGQDQGQEYAKWLDSRMNNPMGYDPSSGGDQPGQGGTNGYTGVPNGSGGGDGSGLVLAIIVGGLLLAAAA